MSKLTDLLGTDSVCKECGRRHRVRVETLCVAHDVMTQLPRVCADHVGPAGHIVMIADVRTLAAAGTAAGHALASAGYRLTPVIVPDLDPHRSPVCDDITREQLEHRAPRADLYVAVGSGVVNDLTKWLAGDRQSPYVALATAASMNGYASDNVAPTLKGVKSLVHGVGPVAIASSPAILAGAPAEMTAAGLGDVLAKSVSTLDWKLNRLLFGEYYCPLCAGLVDDIEPIYMNNPEAIGAGEESALIGLFEALTLTGMAMSMAGTSSPASGGEHLISHTLDMMAMRDDIEHDLHGRQVGVGTILGAALYERILAISVPTLCSEAAVGRTDAAFWRRYTKHIEPHHAGKLAKCAAAIQILTEKPQLWDQIRYEVRDSLRPAKAVKACLRRAGAAHRLVDIGVTRERFMDAFAHAHEMRERFTVLDLARCVGILPGAADELVDQWLVD